jgi:hypothetical protein
MSKETVMKKLVFLPLAALAVAAACAENSPTAVAPAGAVFTQDVSGPTHNITGVYVKSAGSTVVNTHPKAGTAQGGSCVGNVWYNPQGHATSANFCQGGSGGSGGPDFCTFVVTGTYARGGDNQNLNVDLSHKAEADTGNDLHVHYKGQHGETTGRGILAFESSCSESGTLDLAGFTGGGNRFTDDSTLATTGIQVQVGSSSYALAGISWTNRSGVGN